jgi:hypothetical protein
LSDGPGAVVDVDIAAPASVVWPIVTDISFGSNYSEEFVGARWADGHDSPALGAQFIGTNQHPAIGEWTVPCFVHRFADQAEFGWVTSDPDNPGAQWRFELSPTTDGTRLRYYLTMGPGPSGLTGAIERMPDKEPRIIHRRISEHRVNMQRVVDGIKEVAEARRAESKAARRP